MKKIGLVFLSVGLFLLYISFTSVDYNQSGYSFLIGLPWTMASVVNLME